MALGRPRPTALRQHQGNRFAGHQRGLVERLGRRLFLQHGTPRIAVFRGVFLDFADDQFAQPRLAAQQLFQRLALRGQLILLGPDLDFLEPGQVPQAQIEYRFGLLVG